MAKKSHDTFTTKPANCPVCGGENCKILFRVKRPELDENIFYDIRVCKTCTLRYADGPLDENILSKVYNLEFFASSQQYAPIDQNGNFTSESLKYPIVRNAITRVNFLEKLGAKGSLLDIGAGRGYFVKAASKIFDAEGIELSPDAVSFATLVKIKMAHGDFLTYDFGEKKFSVITLWDVFAGMTEPNTFIKKTNDLLTPGGLLVMTLPDGGSLAARMLGCYWPLMIPPGNCSFYTPKSIRKLLRAHGFTIKIVRYHSKWVAVDFLLRKFFRSLRFHKLAGIKMPIPSNWRIQLNTRDIMTVVAVRD